MHAVVGHISDSEITVLFADGNTRHPRRLPMKTKRSGYSRKSNQAAKRVKPQLEQEQSAVQSQNDKKDQPECNGVCAVSWKPAAVAR